MADSAYNYPKTGTTFGSRDTLPVGNANKIISGTQFDPEFNAISEGKLNRDAPQTGDNAFVGFIDGGTF